MQRTRTMSMSLPLPHSSRRWSQMVCSSFLLLFSCFSHILRHAVLVIARTASEIRHARVAARTARAEEICRNADECIAMHRYACAARMTKRCSLVLHDHSPTRTISTMSDWVQMTGVEIESLGRFGRLSDCSQVERLLRKSILIPMHVVNVRRLILVTLHLKYRISHLH
jgi:hypothetical protein